MKIRVSIQAFSHHTEGATIFTSAWARFIRKNIKDLDRFTFIFVNNGINLQTFIENSEITNDFDIVSCPSRPTPLFDTDANYIGMSGGIDDSSYDYLMRVDHDAFPSVESLNNIADFLESNPDITFLSATNFCRSVFHHVEGTPPLDSRMVTGQYKREWKWEPWEYPTNNGDMFIIKRSFLKDCLYRYSSNNLIISNKSPLCTPFHTEVLKWGDICQMLGRTANHIELDDNVPIRIDGGLRSDLWTIMCSSPEMKMAGIVDYNNKSFCLRNHIVTQYNTLSSINGIESAKDGIDSVDQSWGGFEKTVQAPYCHLGNGYLMEWYLTVNTKSFNHSISHFKHHFTSNTYGNYVAHFAIIKYLASRMKNKSMLYYITNVFLPYIEKWGVDLTNLNNHCDSIINFYWEELIDYLS